MKDQNEKPTPKRHQAILRYGQPYEYWIERGHLFGFDPDHVDQIRRAGRQYLGKFVDIECFIIYTRGE